MVTVEKPWHIKFLVCKWRGTIQAQCSVKLVKDATVEFRYSDHHYNQNSGFPHNSSTVISYPQRTRLGVVFVPNSLYVNLFDDSFEGSTYKSI